MSGGLEAFLDTNVLVYAVSEGEGDKHERAREIVRKGFEEGCYAISTQVLLEFYVTATRKLATPLPQDDALSFVTALAEWRVVGHTPDLVLSALAAASRLRISPWDAAILEAAREAGCPRLVSEDLSHGQDYDGIQVENPFR